MSKLIDLTNKRFGRLVVIQRAKNQGGHTRWLCQCDCGKKLTVISQSLREGRSKSCGCLRKELFSKKYAIDEVGNKYGKLTVVRKAKSFDGEGARWLCKCVCGNEIIVLGKSLRSGNTESCGCISYSKGENKIIELLNENNINYLYQFSFQDLVGVNKGKLRFDFAIINDNSEVEYLIEFQGRQHFDENSIYYTKENIIHDKTKQQYCIENNIPLIIIPYTEYNNLSIDDLKITSHFLDGSA